MIIVPDIIQDMKTCQDILNQISSYGDNLEFETWIYSDTIKISDSFVLRTPNIYFEVVKHSLLSKTPYSFSMYDTSLSIKHKKLFNRICAPTIFKACAKHYNTRMK